MLMCLNAQETVVRETAHEQVGQHEFYVTQLPAGAGTWNMSGGARVYGRLVVIH